MEYLRPLFLLFAIFIITACGSGSSSDPTNTNPTANAGPDQAVAENNLVRLAGTFNASGETVTLRWTQTSGIAVALSSTAVANPSFTAPMVSANEALEFTLTVTDGNGVSTADTVVITVNDSAGNNPPIVDAGLDQPSVVEGTTVQLSGSGSDPDGPVTFIWTQTVGITITLSNTTIINPTFTAPMISANETLEFTLTVTDDSGASTADTIVVTVNNLAGNNPPIVDAGPNQSKVEGTTVQLAGMGSDPDGAVTFSWTQTAGISVTLSDTTIVNPTLVAPMVTSTEILEFTLTITDAAMVSVMDTVSITVTDTVTSHALTEAYLFYSPGLNAVDPANPTTSIEIEPAANIVTNSSGETYATLRTIQTGTYDTAIQILTDLHTHAVIYAHTNGNIYKVSTLKSGSLTPIRVSSESMADQLCIESSPGDPARDDFSNVNNSQFLYVLPGIDGLCDTNDDVWKMVRLGMSSTDAPIIAKPTIHGLTDFTTGAISGWLLHEPAAGELQRCDASFANCSTITTVTSSVNWHSQSHNFSLLEIDNQLFVYTVDTDTLSSALFTISAGTYLGDVVSDDNITYFIYGSLIYQLPVNGSAMATVLTTESGDIKRLQRNNNNLVYQLGSGARGTEIKSVSKTGGTPLSLVTTTGTDYLSIMFAKNNRIYYNVLNTTVSGTTSATVPVAAGVIDDDGMNRTETMTAAAWVGVIFTTTLNFNNALAVGDFVEKVIRTEGYDIAGTSGGYAGATITSVDAATSADIVTLGTLPTTDYLHNVSCSGFGDDTLCPVRASLTQSPASPFQSDLFYLNANTDNSLTRVTNTISENERPVR